MVCPRCAPRVGVITDSLTKHLMRLINRDTDPTIM
jgi:hypothetical protein